jgi:hypothetical protein
MPIKKNWDEQDLLAISSLLTNAFALQIPQKAYAMVLAHRLRTTALRSFV